MFGKKYKPGQKEIKIVEVKDAGMFNPYKKTLKKYLEEGWTLESDENLEQKYYSGGKGLLLGIIFLPLALFGGVTKKKSMRRLTFSRMH